MGGAHSVSEARTQGLTRGCKLVARGPSLARHVLFGQQVVFSFMCIYCQHLNVRPHRRAGFPGPAGLVRAGVTAEAMGWQCLSRPTALSSSH